MNSMSWQERLGRAEVEGTFTDEDRDDANDWETCAVKERFGLLQAWGYHPQRSAIKQLGDAFGNAVGCGDIASAYNYYNAIQAIPQAVP